MYQIRWVVCKVREANRQEPAVERGASLILETCPMRKETISGSDVFESEAGASSRAAPLASFRSAMGTAERVSLFEGLPFLGRV